MLGLITKGVTGLTPLAPEQVVSYLISLLGSNPNFTPSPEERDEKRYIIFAKKLSGVAAQIQAKLSKVLQAVVQAVQIQYHPTQSQPVAVIFGLSWKYFLKIRLRQIKVNQKFKTFLLFFKI